VQASGKIDLNLATAEALQTLPGIGAKTAESIMAYRSQNGGFQSVADLERVKGIGPSKLQQLLPYVEVAAKPAVPASSTVLAAAAPAQAIAPAAATPIIAQPIRATPFAATPAPPTGPINFNAASEEQLAALELIGPVLARRIVEYRRQYGVFPSVQSLDRVKGIGPKILQANRHRITVR
jgi:competence ComEA-like helix-hairpin-helix protein